MAINLVVGLVITSYAVNNLGLEVYGAWSILMLFMLLGVIGDQSIASPIVYLAAKYHSSNELQKLSSLYVNGFALVTVICFAFSLIFAFYGKFISMFLFNNSDYLLYVKYPIHTAYNFLLFFSNLYIISIALILGAPLTVPAGNPERRVSKIDIFLSKFPTT